MWFLWAFSSESKVFIFQLKQKLLSSTLIENFHTLYLFFHHQIDDDIFIFSSFFLLFVGELRTHSNGGWHKKSFQKVFKRNIFLLRLFRKRESPLKIYWQLYWVVFSFNAQELRFLMEVNNIIALLSSLFYPLSPALFYSTLF